MAWDDEQNDVSAGSNITDNRLVKGDGGVKGIQETGISVDDSNNITGAGDLAASGNVVVSGQISSTVPSTMTPSGTTQTIDWDNGNFQILDLGSASGNVTVSFSNGDSGAVYNLGIIQSATARTITWPGSLSWPGGTPITLSAGNDEIDFVGMVTTGSTFFAILTENNYS